VQESHFASRTVFLVRGCFALLVVVVALLTAGPAHAGGMFVGAAENDARSLDPAVAKARMDRAARAGFGVVRMTVLWSPGKETVGGDDLVALRNASVAAQLDGVRLILSIYPSDPRSAPRSAFARGEFASFAASAARQFPSITDFVVGNEPNLNSFWMPQFGVGGVDLAARSYELLLAKTYDALKSVSADVNVIGGALSPRGEDKPGAARPTHSPSRFITDLGLAYRARHRRLPIMDMFAIHPYAIPSRLPPTLQHPRTTTIGIADYPKLVRLLTSAFRGTAQRGETLPIVYDEFGYQSQIPRAKQGLYTHLRSPVAKDAIPEALQAAYYRRAFALAACQPTVAGLLIFHVSDERDARAWQSGVYYANGTTKSSLRPVRAAALAAQSGVLAHCATVKTTHDLVSVTFHEPTTPTPTPTPTPSALSVDLTCASPCTYQLRVLDATTGAAVASAAGKAASEQTIAVPTEGLAAGSYQYALRVFKCGKPGTTETRYSRPFALQGGNPVTAPPELFGGLSLPTLLPTVPDAATTTITAPAP
jgi:hypothetical protein